MNILFVNRMMGVAWGGGENFDFQLAQGLGAEGHRVTFLTAEGSEVPQNVATETVRTPYLRRYMYELAGRIRTLPGLIAEFDLKLFEHAAAAAIPAIVERRRIDLIQILALPRLAAHLSRRGGSPVAMRFPGPPAWFHSGLLRRLASHSRVGLFAHGDTVSRLEGLGIPAAEVPPGIDFERYGSPQSVDREALRNSLGLDGTSLLLLSVGRMVPGKGHEFLVQSMPAILRSTPRAHLILAGDGPLRATLERQVQSANLVRQVTFAGQQTSAGVARWLSAADVFCLFSDYENYSNAVLEAMASRLPVLATRVGGFPLQVRDGENGYLVDRGALDQVAERVKQLAQSADLRTALGAKARRFSENFSWRSSAARAAALYERLLRQ